MGEGDTDLSSTDLADDFVVVLDAPRDGEHVVIPPDAAKLFVRVCVDARD